MSSITQAMGLNRLFSLVLFICNWMSALIRMTIPRTVPALFWRKYLKKGSTSLNAFHLHGNMMWHTGGPPIVRSQLVRIPLVRIFKKLSLNSTCTILHQCPPLVQIKLVQYWISHPGMEAVFWTHVFVKSIYSAFHVNFLLSDLGFLYPLIHFW